MPSGQYLATGFMYLNLGCHMLFVLKNRLKAQGIPHDKTAKIIEDLVQGIFKSQLVRGVLAPQEPMSVSTLKEVFRKQALSSIMKLDSASMEKLLFLIVMTLKKEFFLASSPLQLYAVTRGNLATLVQYVQQTSVTTTMKNALELFTASASKLTFMEYHQLREYVLSAMEPYQTKVVNFVEAGQQSDRGKLILLKRNAHNPVPTSNLPLLPLSNWREWKTSLVIDHVREYQRQSERRHAKNEIGKERSLNQLFGGLSVEPDFEVCLQLFDYDQQPQKSKISSRQQVRNSKEAVGSKEGKTESSKIRKLIQQSFSGVGDEGEEELDLLDVMDNS